MSADGDRSWFDAAFRALRGGDDPFPWQREAFRRLVAGEAPGPVDVPPGLGKTAIMLVWLLALARHRTGRGAPVPTRLVYVVNRRAVVDQSSDEARRLAVRLAADDPAMAALRAALGLRDGEGLAVSTLRGQRAEDRAWLMAPDRPAIVVGTVDMIGSRLLFSAYRASPWLRGLYAGLVGQDALIVHDEAHLEPAFDALVHAVAARQDGQPRPARALSLSATTRPGGQPPAAPPLFDRAAHLAHPEAARRLTARRRLEIAAAKAAELPAALAGRALALAAGGGVRGVIVFANTPDTAAAVAERLRARLSDGAADRVAVLTGRMRGHERDRLVDGPAFQAFDPDATEAPPAPAFLVATAAGEVGIDLDATHLVTELATLDALVQRFGRANRRGRGDATLAVLWSERHTDPKLPLGAERARALAVLEGLGGDASPLRLVDALAGADAAAAMAPAPALLPLTAPVVEAWSLTSLPDRALPHRPDPAPWLHGLEEEEPDVTLVWRGEVPLLADPVAAVPPPLLERAVEAMRIAPRERLRLPLAIARDGLARLARRAGRDADGTPRRALLLAPGRPPRVVELAEEGWRRDLPPGATLLLPPAAGGLDADGQFDPKAPPPEEGSLDLAEHPPVVVPPEPPDMDGLRAILHVPLRTAEDGPDSPPSRALVYRALVDEAVLESSSASHRKVKLAPHGATVATRAARIAGALGLPEPLADALRLAGEWHDRGKARRVWQRAIGNHAFTPADPLGTALAKSGKSESAEALGGFRHELASLLDAEADAAVTAHAEADLILHLIAAHHGRGRPWFPADAVEKGGLSGLAEQEAAILRQARRFHALQRRFGPWGLAWLEALLRAADWAASAASEGAEP